MNLTNEDVQQLDKLFFSLLPNAGLLPEKQKSWVLNYAARLAEEVHKRDQGAEL